MESFNPSELRSLYKPPKDSHKGQNGKLTIVGGSHLFHGASLWALKISSRIVDMVFYSSTEENNELTKSLKSKLYDFIAVPRKSLNEYIVESDAVLLGPGLARAGAEAKSEEKTKDLTKKLLDAFPEKKWVIDAGSLTEMDIDWLLQLCGEVILTPHKKEFEWVFGLPPTEENLFQMAKKYSCTILVKGEEDIACNGEKCVRILGGNLGMTKGGTGDVLAGLLAALFCKNDAFLSAAAASYVNKKAGDSLFERVGPYFNASDLCNEIPKVLTHLTK